MHDYIIVGAGFSGSVIARKIAQELDKKVLILEKRPHIAGNMYDEIDAESGVLVQRYGPHTFVTDNPEIVNFIKQYDNWHDFYARSRVEIDGQLMPIPFNFQSVQMFYPQDQAQVLIGKLQSAFAGQERVPVFALTDHSDREIREFGELLYEKDYIPYTCKQWGIPPEKMDRSVLARVKFALSYDDIYMQQKYQMMPSIGFTQVFENMLNHPNITVQTSVDALNGLTFDYEKHCVRYQGKRLPVVFTGPIDELFGLKFGRLPYRSIDIEYEVKAADRIQETPIITYPQAPRKTRTTEYKLLTGQILPGKTLVATEYPVEYTPELETGNVPFYPVINDGNLAQYRQYRELADSFENLYVCGRLGDYKYYNMDAAILRALEVYQQVCSRT
ncbi:UDP-galactopyranose mutase [Faecalispora jeddahensis]|uniref:UDP-galactopyranose mutase n=1 Tax=Faecalispora jeddahensis TaxID=1414721 RepID=UPI0027B892A8|nr:UDP-galactopyranose mutase [Faecalispora jeddahensis]